MSKSGKIISINKGPKAKIFEISDYKVVADGKAAPYIHGEAKDAGATIELVYDLELISDAAENAQVIELPDSDYVLLSEGDIEKEVNEGTA